VTDKKQLIVLGATGAGTVRRIAGKLITDAGFEVVEADLEGHGRRIEKELQELARREVREMNRSPLAGYERRNKSDRKRNKSERWR